ncbi:acetyl-CoA C-acyltransferase [Eupransor demetentiae]|uniref:acetyl-CoA C-acyltransferase n=1 Tax=Eupransor demetentiae TaxID=3109584 RepID=A0ABM9N414_9LACO|nr:Acetyl-CoA acetyltransferase (PaaJ) [Lactobacillaceae bacterium LMG 33000]
MKYDSAVAILSAKRLPIGKIHGQFADESPENLYAELIRGQFQELELGQEKIEGLYLGNVTNQGGNLARRAGLAAAFPVSIPAQSIDCQCGSGLAAIINAANAIKAGDATYLAAGGIESTSTARLVLDQDKQPLKRFPMAPNGFEDLDMGLLAERAALTNGISRQAMDQYALKSHQKASQAIASGQIAEELIPYKGINRDETVRPNSSFETLSKLKPAFKKEGTITAGNACPINDGASSVILGSPTQTDFQSAIGYYLGQSSLGLLPKDFLLGPIQSTEELLKKYELNLDEIDCIELNEAFAVQAILFQEHFNLDDAKLNQFGGALAFGHPYGATGGILVARLLNRLNRIDRPALGIATMCVAGGMGISLLIANRHWQNKKTD